MIKTKILSGVELKVENLEGFNTVVHNLSDSSIYASKYPNIAPGADNVAEIPMGAAKLISTTKGIIYLLGTGKVELTGQDHYGVNCSSSSSTVYVSGTSDVNKKYVDEQDALNQEDANAYTDEQIEAVNDIITELQSNKVDKTEINNPNLLDNWYFLDPINQRGQAEYTGSGYMIDRWIHDGSDDNVAVTISTVEDGLNIKVTNKRGTKFQKNLLYQFIESGRVPEGKYTLSFIYTSNCAIRPFLTKGSVLPGFKDFPASDTPALATITCNMPNNDSKLDISIQVNETANCTINLIAAKLELGDRQTLARQEGGKWVLNDPPPNKVLELAKCQRYYQRYKDFSFSLTDTLSGEKARGNSVLFPVQFRITPAMKINKGSNGYYGSTSEYKYIRDISSFNAFMLNESLMVIQTSDSELANLSVRLYDVEFSADI